LGKKGGTIQETLKINIVTQLDNIDQTVKTMRDNLSNLNLGASTQKEFNQILSGITEKVKNLRASTKDGVIKFADQNQVIKDIKAIEQRLQRLGIDTDFLSVNEKNLQKSAKVIEQMTAERRKYTAAVEETNKKEQAAQERVNKWQIQKDNVSQVVKGYNALANVLVQATQKAEATQKALEEAQDQLDSFMASEKNDNSEAAKAEIQRLKKNVSTKKGQNTKAHNAVAKAQADLDNYDLSEFDGNINKANKRLNEINDNLKKAKQNLAALKQQDIGAARFEDLKKNLESMKDIDWSSFGVDFSKIQSLEDFNSVLKSIKDSSGKGAEEAIEAINRALQSALGSAGSMENEMEQVSDQFDRLAAQKRDIDSLRQSLLNFFGIQNAIQLFKRAVREAYESVTELDKAMTQTAVVTDFSVSDMWDQLPEYTKMANELGTTTLGAYETATLFYQQGLKTNEVMEVSTETMKMARIAGMDYVDATNMMTAALRGFNMEINETSAQKVNDVYSELAKITASDTQEISTAMTKTASIAHNAGMEFETTAAFLSQIIETTRESAETAGTAMKTIVARFTELKKNPNELVEVDGEQVDANKIETALRSVGVALRDSNGEFRKLDDVFLDLAKRWDSLTVNQQRYVATMAAGSRQQSRFIAMMSNYDRTIELVNAAYNSAGSSQEQFEKTTESLESKINRLHNAWQEFTMNLSNSAIIKGAVDMLTGFLNIINKIITVGDTMNNSLVSFGLTLGFVIKTFSTLGKVYDKYGDKIFNGLKSISKLTKPADIAADVKSGTETGVQSAQAKVYEATRTSIFNATRDGMTAGAEAAKVTNGAAPSGADVPDIDGNMPPKATKELGEEIGDSVEEAINKNTAQIPFKQSLGQSFSGGLQAGQQKAFGQWEKLASNVAELLSSGDKLKFSFQKLAKDGAAKLGAALGGLINPITVLIASIGATIGVVKLAELIVDKSIHTADEQIAEMNEALEGVNSNISSLSSTLTGITEQKDKFNNLSAELEGLTRGTVEYEEARRESNDIIRKILESNPELNSHARYEDGLWKPDAGFWETYKKNTEDAITKAINSKGVLESVKTEAELKKAANEVGNTTDITESEQKGINAAAGWTGGALGVTTAVVGTVITAVMGALTAGAAVAPMAAITVAASAAMGGVGAGIGGGIGTLVAKTGESLEDVNLTLSKLSTERGATFTDEEIKKFSEGVFSGAEAESLVDKVFQGNDAAAQKFFKGLDGSAETLNKAIEALDRNTAQLAEEQYNATGGDAEGKYYYSTEATKADRKRAFDVVKDAVDWSPEWKEQGKIIEGTGKTVASYLDEILKDREGYTKDSKGRWTYEGKLLNLEKNDQLTNEIAGRVAVDLQKERADSNKTAYQNMSPDEKRDYKNYQTERVKQYKSEDWEDIKVGSWGFNLDYTLTKEQQADYFKKIGVEEGKETKDQKRIAAYIRKEAEAMGGTDEEIDDRYKSALEYYNNSYDLQNISYDDFVSAVKDGIANSNITILNTEENKALDEWGGNWDEASEEARKNIYKLGTTFEGEGKALATIFDDLKDKMGDKADDIFADADLTSKEGIDKFVQSLRDAGADAQAVQDAFGVSLDELSDHLLSLSGLLPSISDKAASAADAYTLANQIAQDAMMSFSQQQYDLITKMDSDLSDAFFKIGDAFYYTEGSAYQLAQALSTAATTAFDKYKKILNREEGVGASDYNRLSDEQKKRWKYNKQTGKYDVKKGVGKEEYQQMMETMGYSYDKALGYAAQLGDVTAILNSKAQTPEEEKKRTQALKAMALQYGATAEEINGLNDAELANVVTAKKWSKQAEASAKGLKANTDKLKELKKESSKYKSTLATMAEQINVLGGVEGVVNSDWVAKHMSDIKAMANGDEAAAERVRKAWARTYADTVKTAGTNLNKILKDANFTSDQIEALSNQLYEFKLTGKADFTDLYNSLMAVYQDTGKVLEILKQIAGTNVKLSYDYEYAELDSRNGADRADLIDMERNGWEVVSKDKGITKLRRMKGVKAVDSSITEGWTTPAFTNPGGTRRSSSSANEKTPWENPYDRLYNLTQRINTEIRKRNRLESEYNRLVQYGLGNASDLAKKTEQERKSLEQQKALQQQLLAERKKDVEKLNNNKYSKYARYDMATGNVVLNNDLINKNKNEDIGKGIEEQVSKLEELKGEIEGAEDALWDIEDQLYELTQRGRDEYIDFQKDVYNALIKQRQDEIDKYSEYISTLAEAKSDILDALRKYIDKQRQERDNAEREKEIADKDAQLFRMERDTGSTQADIIAARKDVEQMRRDYTDELIDQKISELEEQNDEAQKVREKQLETMQKQLEEDQKSGVLWAQVKTLMEEGWGPDGKIIEGSELERILTDYYEYTQMSEEERAKAIEQRNMNTTLAKQYLDAKNAGKNTYTPSTSYPDVSQTPKKNPTSNSGAKALTVGTRVRTVGFGNAASDGSGNRAAKGLSNRKILKIRKGAKYPYLIGTSNDPSGWTGWYTAAALQAYKKGGLANFTGPAWLDGTKSRPEAVLNARDTENFLQLRDILGEVLTKTRDLGNSNSENNGDNYYDIDIQVDRLSNDYDVDQLVRKIKKEITKDANYRNVRTINLKR
jgi:TP901 family phage tail tape measure protein